MNSRNPFALASSIASLIAIALAASHEARGQAISINAPGTFTENFDIIGPSTIAWTDGVTIPGWHAGINSNATADGNLQENNGDTNGTAGALAGLLNLGHTGDLDRALGSKSTSTGGFANVAYGVLFQNTTGASLQITNLGYAGEVWHANAVGTTPEFWNTFYKVSNTLFTDTEPGGNTAAAALGSFTALPSADITFPTNFANNAKLDGNLAANRVVRSVLNPGIILAPGDYFMFRWVDANQPNNDSYQGIDDFSITFASYTPARNLTYNPAHIVGGAPNGSIELSANQYWLDGGSPAAMLESDNLAFSQDGTMNINVPANISAASVTVSANSGTITIGGPGAISSTLTKTGDSVLALTSANSFTSTTLGGGTVITSNVGSLGAAALNVTSSTTLTTNSDLTLGGGISGSGLLVKNGPGILTLGGSGNGNGGIFVSEGGLRADTTAALGGDLQLVTLEDGASLEFTGGAGTFSAAGTSRTLIANGTNTITVGGAGNLEFLIVDTLAASGTLIKEGTGTLRTTVDQGSLTATWIVNAGNLELQTNNGLGTGDILMNGGVLVVRGNPGVTLANNVTLNGGALSTRSGDAGIVAGTLNVIADSFIHLKSNTSPANPQSITVSGQVIGDGDITITGNVPLTAGAKAAVFTNPSNTYSGNITVTSQQTMASESFAGSGSAIGAATITLGGGTLRILDSGIGDNGALDYTANSIVVINPTDINLPGVATITLDRSLGGVSVGNTAAFGSLTIGSQSLFINGLNDYKAAFTNGIVGGAATINANTHVTVSGPVTGTGSITKDGPGKLEINDTSDPTVDFVVNAGTLQGTGKIGGNVTALGGSVAPGSDSIGTLEIGGNVTFAAGAALSIDLADDLPGLNYDLIKVGTGGDLTSTGVIDLGGSFLNINASPDIDLGDLFFIFNNDGTDAVTGTFSGLTDDTIITIGTQEFQISYDANFASATLDGGNDVALLAVPEPASARTAPARSSSLHAPPPDSLIKSASHSNPSSPDPPRHFSMQLPPL